MVSKTAMIAITTSNSISVKPRLCNCIESYHYSFCNITNRSATISSKALPGNSLLNVFTIGCKVSRSILSVQTVNRHHRYHLLLPDYQESWHNCVSPRFQQPAPQDPETSDHAAIGA